ncbi:MAG TPA: hypothetical protein VLH18_00420, partial [Candidatus Limnocylindrales bacterium]|nr:hypothetical protein [Candidatus Limnocylindrales bacterium]
MDRKLTYETRGLNRVTKELSAFFMGIAKNNFTVEFFTIFSPIIILWETLPRLGVLPPSLVPPPSVVAVAFGDLIINHDLLGHMGISLLRFFLGLAIAIATAIPIGILMG